jgi:cellobiose-specific phosphotransferase system component IIB
MKKLLFLLAAGIMSVHSFAQNGFYLTPYVGAGIGNAQMNYPNPKYVRLPTKKEIFTYRAGLQAGYKKGHLRFEAGVQYGTSGYRYTDQYFLAPLPDSIYIGGEKIVYNHLSVPIRFGYEFNIAKHLKFLPYLGIAPSYNLGATEIISITGKETVKTKLTKEEFDDSYRRISFWANASARLEYDCSNRYSVFVGPSVEYMLTDFVKALHNIPPEYVPSQRNYNVHIEVGARINL